MDIIKQTREYCKALQNTEEYKALDAARTVNDADESLQKLIGDFNLKRMAYTQEMNKETPDETYTKNIQNELKEIYELITENENMQAYNKARAIFDEALEEAVGIIQLCANGADPDTCEVPQQSSCGGSCSTCGGCG